ncbi:MULTISPECIES: hypothetical protein [Actinomyces]|uniref:SRPBCC family protein n=1 Tax=Actinomyces respiraculi TaxID=2744574 RepID=A0A7T0PVB2_9ACTO|nr:MULTISPECIES: hypothetical protein [Actinomyces]QPL05136.1 hypothetical protein ID810_10445 [Actinomyces respiraculi]
MTRRTRPRVGRLLVALASAAALAAVTAGGVVYVAGRLRPRGNDAEPLPGDDLLPGATLVETHETMLTASAAAVWPWLVQMGYGRGGFYTFDVLQRLAGVGIVNADAIDPAWQDLAEGDRMCLAEDLSLAVALLEPERCLVLSSQGGSAPADSGMDFDFTWAFVLAPTASGTCRLIVRERYVLHTPAAARMVRSARPVARLMTHGMLHGLRRRTSP